MLRFKKQHPVSSSAEPASSSKHLTSTLDPTDGCQRCDGAACLLLPGQRNAQHTWRDSPGTRWRWHFASQEGMLPAACCLLLHAAAVATAVAAACSCLQRSCNAAPCCCELLPAPAPAPATATAPAPAPAMAPTPASADLTRHTLETYIQRVLKFYTPVWR